jgi:hypothetical protein
MLKNKKRILLDPCMYELSNMGASEEVEYAHFYYLSRILDFINENLDVLFDLYEGAPYYPDGEIRPPLTRYHYIDYQLTFIYSAIQNKINYDEYIELAPYLLSTIKSDFFFPENSALKEGFLKYITYIAAQELELFMFIGQQNHNVSIPLLFALNEDSKFETIPICDPELDCNNQLYRALKETGSNDIFPYSTLCTKINQMYMKESQAGIDQSQRMAKILTFGKEAALRNGYQYNQILSNRNSTSTSKRVIFNRHKQPHYYLSLDFESGGFEVFDHKGDHLGQYSFDGRFNKAATPESHKIKIQ